MSSTPERPATPASSHTPDGPGAETEVSVPVRRNLVDPVPLAVRRGAATGAAGPARSWSPVGTVDGGVLAEVDPAGLVHMMGTRWSLDWWVGAEDRWHHPSMEAGVRQEPLDGAPVPATALRVPGGDVVQRVGGVQATAASVGGAAWAGPAVLVEVENRSAVPVALALSVRPWLLDGAGSVTEVRVDGSTVLVDGRPAVLLSRPPARTVHGATGETAPALAAGDDAEPFAVARRDGGDLEVVLVVPLAHTATARVLLPATTAATAPAARGRGRGGRWGSAGRRGSGGGPVAPWQAPGLDSVAAGWAAHSADDPRIVVPLAAWSEFVAWSAPVLRLAGPAEVTRALDPAAAAPLGATSGARVGAVAEALSRIEVAEANDAVAAALAGAQRFSGAVELADRSDATAALLFAASAVLLGRRGAERADELVGPVAKAVRHLAKQVASAPVPVGTGDAEVGGVGARRCAAALRAVAPALAAVGQPEVAEDALAAAGAIELARSAIPSAPASGPAAAQGGPGPTEAAARSTFTEARVDRDLVGASDPAGLQRLAARLVDRGRAGVGDAVDGSGRPAGVLGFDVAELAETRSTLLDALVADGADGPRLLPAWTAAWLGQPVEAHEVPTAWGRVSFALRWHGERPAVLWQVEPSLGTTDSTAAPVLHAPGPDPAWSGTGWSGEGLLTAPGGGRGRAGDDEPAGPAEGESFA